MTLGNHTAHHAILTNYDPAAAGAGAGCLPAAPGRASRPYPPGRGLPQRQRLGGRGGGRRRRGPAPGRDRGAGQELLALR
ncbi:MAG: hypothetical protein WKG07_39425 [Hymenobacter sp.]